MGRHLLVEQKVGERPEREQDVVHPSECIEAREEIGEQFKEHGSSPPYLESYDGKERLQCRRVVVAVDALAELC